MTRKKENISGWLNLYKPYGLTSMQATAKVRRLLNAAKAGHAGTLDPLAEGVLPIAFGEATKLIPLMHDLEQAHNKEYRFTVQWGAQTSTDDAEGEVVATSANRPTIAAIHSALPHFTGTITQVPPAFSAIKVNGIRSYAAARQGEAVALPARQVTIARLELLAGGTDEYSHFEVSCGTGTYVRALARDLALFLGTVGHCTRIIRTKAGAFRADQAILLDSFEEMAYESRLAILQPLVFGLDDIPAIDITETEAQRLRTGQGLSFLSLSAADRLPQPAPAGPVLAMCGNQLIALCRLESGVLRPARVINPTA